MEIIWQPLGAGKWIAVTGAHTFGTDAVLLADFAALKAQDVPMDLGTGCAIIPMLWYVNGYEGRIQCLDIQPSAVEVARRSAQRNGLDTCLQVHELDLRRAAAVFARGTFSLVTMNPPYFPSGTGAVSRDGRARTARHESDCTLEEICTAADYLLKFGGRFCICCRPERLADVIQCGRRYALEPKRLRLAASGPRKAPYLFLMELRKGGKPGLRILPELVLRDGQGRPTEEVKAVYGPYWEAAQV